MANRSDSSRDKPTVTTDHGSAGRLEVDAAGNKVWRWASDSSESTSILIKKLDNTNLSLEPTLKVPVVGGGATNAPTRNAPAPSANPKPRPLSVTTDKRDRDGGFDPYNSRRR
jgi:hypothetical protein